MLEGESEARVVSSGFHLHFWGDPWRGPAGPPADSHLPSSDWLARFPYVLRRSDPVCSPCVSSVGFSVWGVCVPGARSSLRGPLQCARLF